MNGFRIRSRRLILPLVLVLGGCKFSLRRDAPVEPVLPRVAGIMTAGPGVLAGTPSEAATSTDAFVTIPEQAEFHFYFGVPEVDDDAEVLILHNEGYSVGFSEELEVPLWVCYQLFRVGDAGSFPRLRRFRTDHRSESRTNHDDYTRSGYDRGHMAPSSGIGRRWRRNAQDETYFMTNICPQLPTLNQETWEALERRVSDEYAESFENVWVVAGSIFFEDAQCIELQSGVRVPDAFYKIIVAEVDAEPGMLAVIMDQEVTGRRQLRTLTTTVDEIEELTGIDFFHALEDSIEDDAEGSEPDAMWEINRMLVPVFDGRPRTIRTQACNEQ